MEGNYTHILPIFFSTHYSLASSHTQIQTALFQSPKYSYLPNGMGTFSTSLYRSSQHYLTLVITPFLKLSQAFLISLVLLATPLTTPSQEQSLVLPSFGCSFKTDLVNLKLVTLYACQNKLIYSYAFNYLLHAYLMMPKSLTPSCQKS